MVGSLVRMTQWIGGTADNDTCCTYAVMYTVVGKWWALDMPAVQRSPQIQYTDGRGTIGPRPSRRRRSTDYSILRTRTGQFEPAKCWPQTRQSVNGTADNGRTMATIFSSDQCGPTIVGPRHRRIYGNKIKLSSTTCQSEPAIAGPSCEFVTGPPQNDYECVRARS